MKKHIYWILALVVLIFIIALYAFVPYVYTFWFRVRHVLVYGLTLYILLLVGYFILHWLKGRFQLNKTISLIIISLSTTLFILLALTLSTLQMRYISFYEIPPLEGCSYYDGHGNFLYSSQYDASCPELEDVLTKTSNGEQTLSFNITEEFIGGGRIVSSVDGNIAVQEFDISDSSLQTSISITYFDKRFIQSVSLISYEVQERVNTYNQSKTTYARMMTRDVTIVLGDEVVEIITTTGVYEETSQGHVEPVFPELASLDTQTTTLTSLVTPKDDYSAYLDINKTWHEDEEEQTDWFLKGDYVFINDPLITLDYYEEDRATGDSLNVYFDYTNISFRHEEENPISYGVDESVHTRYISFVDTPRVFYDIFAEGEFYVFKDFQFRSTPPTQNLSSTRSVNYLIANSRLYAMEDKQTSKYTKTDYGYKIEDYSTRRYRNGSYYPDFQHRPTYEILDLYNIQTGRNFDDYYNYESFLRYPGLLSSYHFYQHNLLLEGHFYKEK